ncbi:ribosome maturation factor RimP [Fusibacter sp. JL216-2]|uniref:ribosome maturation factor RimP n=1 Tax=Fusibacter sp. JL216-2 TaxID=3071453 RepID=UPI003D34981D
MKRRKGSKKRVVELVRELIEGYCTENDLEIVDIEFVKEGPHRYLRIIIDKEDGIGLDDCGLVSKFLNKKLDEVDPIEENYFLEVTSPGVERQLKKDEDFEKYAGKQVQANLFQPIDGEKVIQGKLIGLKDNKIILERDDSSTVDIPKSKAAVVKLLVTF